LRPTANMSINWCFLSDGWIVSPVPYAPGWYLNSHMLLEEMAPSGKWVHYEFMVSILIGFSMRTYCGLSSSPGILRTPLNFFCPLLPLSRQNALKETRRHRRGVSSLQDSLPFAFLPYLHTGCSPSSQKPVTHAVPHVTSGACLLDILGSTQAWTHFSHLENYSLKCCFSLVALFPAYNTK
jgi:hypothetical protein